jgi:hypothetical protein
MKSKTLITVAVAVFCLTCIGCKKEELPVINESMKKDLREHIANLRTDKEKIEKTIVDLNSQVNQLKLHIVSLEQVYEHSFNGKKPEGFLSNFRDMNWQHYVIMLLLFVIWLLYINLQREKRSSDD